MKKVIFALLLGSLAQAQTSTTSVTTAAESPSSESTISAPLPSSESSAKKFSFTILSENAATVAALKESGTSVKSQNSFGLTYAQDSNRTFEFRAITQTEFGKLSEDKAQRSDVTKMADPTIHYNYKSSLTVMGSDQLTFSSRYYIPVSDTSRDEKSNGALRSQTSLDWALNTQVAAGVFGLAQVFLADPASIHAGESKLRLLGAPYMAYSFNDKFNTYYAANLETYSSNASRGDFSADLSNKLIHEVGVNLKVGKWLIKPFLLAVTDKQGSSTYEGLGSDNNTEYNLEIAAAF